MKYPKLLHVMLVLLLSGTAYAQVTVTDSVVQDPTTRINHILQHLDWSQESPPLLLDEGVDLVGVCQFDGADDTSKVIDTRVLGLAYGSLKSMPATGGSVMADASAAYSTFMSNLGTTDTIPIMGILHE